MKKLNFSNKNLKGTIKLDGSKSISNRLLAIQALTTQDFSIENLSTSKDTVTFQKIMTAIRDGVTLDCGHAGTTFRFMTSILAFKKGSQILTGSKRMQERPIGVLVDALRELGADIIYLKNEGYPPLKISNPKSVDNYKLTIQSNISSQYISALLMLAPTLPKGLILTLDGAMVSRSYIEMTLKIMSQFGISYQWIENTITILPQDYIGKPMQVEADWSAASYYYSLAAFSDTSEINLEGLFQNSVQGDSVMVDIMSKLNIKTTFTKKGILISKPKNNPLPEVLEWDFINCPDIAQTVIVICGGLGIVGMFTGLETLKIKETDRIQALKDELLKIQVFFMELPGRLSKTSNAINYLVEGKAVLDQPIFSTYNDHRMAMAFAPLALLGEIEIENPDVVVKSYSKFWDDLEIVRQNK